MIADLRFDELAAMPLEALVRAFLVRERVKLDRSITVSSQLIFDMFYKFVHNAILDSRGPHRRGRRNCERVGHAPPALNEVVINLAVERKQRPWLK